MKIYLSKSYNSNPDLIIGIKYYLMHNIKNAEIVEFNGGEYTTKLLEKCDIIVAVPPGCTIINETGTMSVNVGKGVYGELKTAHNLGKRVIVAKCNEDQDPLKWKELACFIPINMKVIDRDWKINYAVIEGKIIADISKYNKKEEESIIGMGFL